MSWSVGIQLKSGGFVSVDDLVSINNKIVFDSSVEILTNFNDFHLLEGANLSFVGNNMVVSLNSDDIEYVNITKSS